MIAAQAARFSAPGKLFLMGEYAVRDGFPAVVMPIDRYVCLSQSYLTAGNETLPNFACSECERLLGVERSEDSYVADSSRLRQGDLKLGLGSSAAVCACAVASVFHRQGWNIEDDDVRYEMWCISRRIHDRFQKLHGSGADLAASFFGKTIVVNYEKNEGLKTLDENSPKPGLELTFLWTGRPSSTPRLVTSVDGWRQIDPAGYREIIGEMGELSARYAAYASDVNRTGNGDLLPIIRRYCELMDVLGKKSGTAIVDQRTRIAALEAQRAGGALKPSGAGGGDILLATFAAGVDRGPFLERMADMGLQPISLGMARHGVRAEIA